MEASGGGGQFVEQVAGSLNGLIRVGPLRLAPVLPVQSWNGIEPEIRDDRERCCLRESDPHPRDRPAPV